MQLQDIEISLLLKLEVVPDIEKKGQWPMTKQQSRPRLANVAHLQCSAAESPHVFRSSAQVVVVGSSL